MLHRFSMSWSVTWCLNCLECVGSLPFVLECINRFRLFLDVTKNKFEFVFRQFQSYFRLKFLLVVLTSLIQVVCLSRLDCGLLYVV